MKELKDLKTIARENLERIEIEEQEIQKTPQKTANLTSKLYIVSKKIPLPHFLEDVKELAKQAKENKVSEKRIRTIEIFKNAIIKK